jgi:hypothetical protein
LSGDLVGCVALLISHKHRNYRNELQAFIQSCP